MTLKAGRSEFVARLLICLLAVLFLWVLWSLRSLLIILMGAIVVAVLLRSVAEPISRRTGLGTRGSTAIAVALASVVVATSAWLFGTQFAHQLDQLLAMVPHSLAALHEQIKGIPFATTVLDSLMQGHSLSARLAWVVRVVGDAMTALLLICFGSIFLAAQPRLYRDGVILLVPTRQRELAGEAIDDAGRALRRWLLGQLISMIVVGMLTGIGLWLANVPSPIALGLIAAFTEGVPYLGPIIGSVPGLLAAITQGPTTALWALVVYVAVQQIEGNTLVPLIHRKMVSLPPALTLFWIMAAGLLFGVLGLVFATPMLVVVYVLVKRLYIREALDTQTSVPGDNLTVNVQKIPDEE